MSKLSKLVKNPILFFEDFIKNRALEKPTSKKYSLKKSAPKVKDEFNFNKFELYTHLLHTGENVTGLSHLDLWISQFLKANVDFLIMIRNYELFETVKEKYPQLTVLFAKGDKEIQYYLNQLVFLKACFYPSNTGSNMHLLKFNDLKHIFIGHGDSDKTASAHKYFRVYDENWVAGKAHIDRFVNEKFDFSGLNSLEVGRPNLKETLKISQTPWRERFDSKLNLLYLSTWEGVYQEQNYTSVYFIKNFFNLIINKKLLNTINIKIHPAIGRRDEKLLSTNQELQEVLEDTDIIYNLYDKSKPVEDIIKESNIFICDISAVVSESLAANAPIFVYIPKDKEIKLTKSKMMYDYYTYTFSNLDELFEKIEDVIVNNNDYLSSKREEAMEYILGKNNTLNDEFIQQLQKV